MEIEQILSWVDEMIEKYAIEDEDVLALQEILNGVEEEDMYGDEYQDEVPEEEV